MDVFDLRIALESIKSKSIICICISTKITADSVSPSGLFNTDKEICTKRHYKYIINIQQMAEKINLEFSSLPDEVLQTFLKNLSFSDLKSVVLVSKCFQKLGEDPFYGKMWIFTYILSFQLSENLHYS